MDKIKCIYAIKDKRNDKVIYVGKTHNFDNRKSQHFTTTIQSIDMYMFEQGRDNFEMYIIEELSDKLDEELKNKEQEYIYKYNTIENGFNKLLSGNISKDKKQYEKDYYKKSEKFREHKREYQNLYREKNKEKRNEYARVWYRIKKQQKIEINNKIKSQL